VGVEQAAEPTVVGVVGPVVELESSMIVVDVVGIDDAVDTDRIVLVVAEAAEKVESADTTGYTLDCSGLALELAPAVGIADTHLDCGSEFDFDNGH
jgi:hypothetical protein